MTRCQGTNGRLRDVRREVEEWRLNYDAKRPHTSLNRLTPNEFIVHYLKNTNSRLSVVSLLGRRQPAAGRARRPTAAILHRPCDKRKRGTLAKSPSMLRMQLTLNASYADD